MNDLKTALKVWFKDNESKFGDDPFHLTFVPLSESPTYEEEKAQRLYAQYLSNGLINYDSEHGTSLWIGPSRTSYQGRPCSYLKIIFCSLCSMGIPQDYHPVSSGGNFDITPKHLFLHPYEGVKKIQHDPGLYPFLASTRMKMFGNLSPSRLWDRMDGVKSKEPTSRWRDLVKLSEFVQTVRGSESIEAAVQIAEDCTLKHPEIKYRVQSNKGTEDHYPCYVLSKVTGDDINTMTHPLRLRLMSGSRTVRLHHYMWRQVFGELPSDMKRELSTCPNKWCVNPFHYLLRSR